MTLFEMTLYLELILIGIGVVAIIIRYWGRAHGKNW